MTQEEYALIADVLSRHQYSAEMTFDELVVDLTETFSQHDPLSMMIGPILPLKNSIVNGAKLSNAWRKEINKRLNTTEAL